MVENDSEKSTEKRSVDIIREMNPGKYIPTGAELAKKYGNRAKKRGKKK